MADATINENGALVVPTGFKQTCKYSWEEYKMAATRGLINIMGRDTYEEREADFSKWFSSLSNTSKEYYLSLPHYEVDFTGNIPPVSDAQKWNHDCPFHLIRHENGGLTQANNHIVDGYQVVWEKPLRFIDSMCISCFAPASTIDKHCRICRSEAMLYYQRSNLGVHDVGRIEHAAKVIQKMARSYIKWSREMLKIGNPFEIVHYYEEFGYYRGNPAKLEEDFKSFKLLRWGWCPASILDIMPIEGHLKDHDEIIESFTKTKEYHTYGLIRFTIFVYKEHIMIQFWNPDLDDWRQCIVCELEEADPLYDERSCKYKGQQYCYHLKHIPKFSPAFIQNYMEINDILYDYGWATRMDVDAGTIERNKGNRYSVCSLGDGYHQTPEGAKYTKIIYEKHFYCRDKFFFQWRQEISDEILKECPKLCDAKIPECYCPNNDELVSTEGGNNKENVDPGLKALNAVFNDHFQSQQCNSCTKQALFDHDVYQFKTLAQEILEGKHDKMVLKHIKEKIALAALNNNQARRVEHESECQGLKMKKTKATKARVKKKRKRVIDTNAPTRPESQLERFKKALPSVEAGFKEGDNKLAEKLFYDDKVHKTLKLKIRKEFEKDYDAYTLEREAYMTKPTPKPIATLKKKSFTIEPTKKKQKKLYVDEADFQQQAFDLFKPSGLKIGTEVIIQYQFKNGPIAIKESPFFLDKEETEIDYAITMQYLRNNPQAIVVGGVMDRLPSGTIDPVINFKTYVGFDASDYRQYHLSKKDINIIFTISNFACLKKDTSIEEPAQLRPTHGPREEPMLVDEEKMPDDTDLIMRKHAQQQKRDAKPKFEYRDGKLIDPENGDEYNSAEGEQDSGNESDKAFINNAQTNMLPVTPSSSQDSGKSDISLSSTETPDPLSCDSRSLPAPEIAMHGPSDFSHLAIRKSTRISARKKIDYAEEEQRLDNIVEAEMMEDDRLNEEQERNNIICRLQLVEANNHKIIKALGIGVQIDWMVLGLHEHRYRASKDLETPHPNEFYNVYSIAELKKLLEDEEYVANSKQLQIVGGTSFQNDLWVDYMVHLQRKANPILKSLPERAFDFIAKQWKKSLEEDCNGLDFKDEFEKNCAENMKYASEAAKCDFAYKDDLVNILMCCMDTLNVIRMESGALMDAYIHEYYWLDQDKMIQMFEKMMNEKEREEFFLPLNCENKKVFNGANVKKHILQNIHIQNNLKIVKPLDLDDWQRLDYKGYIAKLKITIALSEKVERWQWNDFHDYILRHLGIDDDEFYKEYPNNMRMLGALIEATIHDPAMWHIPVQYYKFYRLQCNEALSHKSMVMDDFGQPYKYLIGESNSPLFLEDKNLPLIRTFMELKLPYAPTLIEELFERQAKRHEYTSNSHMVFSYYVDYLPAHAFRDWWQRPKIKQMLRDQTYHRTAKAIFQASYPNTNWKRYDTGTSSGKRTLDEFFTQPTRVWGNTTNVRKIRNGLRVRILMAYCKDPDMVNIELKSDKLLQSVLVRDIKEYAPYHLFVMQTLVNTWWENMP